MNKWIFKLMDWLGNKQEEISRGAAENAEKRRKRLPPVLLCGSAAPREVSSCAGLYTNGNKPRFWTY
jgi:hypothetical protein